MSNVKMLVPLLGFLLFLDLQVFAVKVKGSAVDMPFRFETYNWTRDYGSPKQTANGTTAKQNWIMVMHRAMNDNNPHNPWYRYHNLTLHPNHTSWELYQRGFKSDMSPDMKSDFVWLGLEAMHDLTLYGSWQVLFGYKTNSSIRTNSTNKPRVSYVIYNNFKIDDEADKYTLHVGSKVKAGGRFKSRGYLSQPLENGTPFCVPDMKCQNENATKTVERFQTGWWFSAKGSSLCITCPNGFMTGKVRDRDFTETFMGMRRVA